MLCLNRIEHTFLAVNKILRDDIVARSVTFAISRTKHTHTQHSARCIDTITILFGPYLCSGPPPFWFLFGFGQGYRQFTLQYCWATTADVAARAHCVSEEPFLHHLYSLPLALSFACGGIQIYALRASHTIIKSESGRMMRRRKKCHWSPSTVEPLSNYILVYIYKCISHLHFDPPIADDWLCSSANWNKSNKCKKRTKNQREFFCPYAGINSWNFAYAQHIEFPLNVDDIKIQSMGTTARHDFDRDSRTASVAAVFLLLFLGHTHYFVFLRMWIYNVYGSIRLICCFYVF